MRYVAAYVLAAMGGNENPGADDVKQILASVGIDVDDEQLDIVLKNLEGKNIAETIAAGREKLASMPTGGAAPAAAAAAAPAEEEVKEEEKKEESEEESDDDMGFDLFG